MLGPLESLIRLHEIAQANPDGPSTARAANELERCKAELPTQLVDRHEYLISRYGASAVVPIKSGCCSGCYVQIPSSRSNRVEEGIYACEQCGRLLYDEARVYSLLHV